MGLWPTRGNKNRRCRPRESGDPLPARWILACAGMTHRARFSGEYPWACSPPQPMKVEHEGLTVENDDML